MSRVYVKGQSVGKARARREAARASARSTTRAQRYAAARTTSVPAALYSSYYTGATETKCVDTLPRSFTIPVNGTVQWIDSPQEGSSFYNRIGRRVRGKSLEIRGHLRNTNTNSANISQIQEIRLLVVYDRQVNGVTPAYQDVIRSYFNDGTTQSSLALDGVNMNNRDRFMILRDRRIILPPVGINGAPAVFGGGLETSMSADGDKGSFNYHEFIKLKGLESHFKATTDPSDVGDVSTGAYFIVAAITSNASGTPAWEFVYQTRFKFHD